MTISEYLQSKYSSFGVSGFEGEVEALIVSGALSPEEPLTSSNLKQVEMAFVKRIPELLLFPTNISELGVSISRTSKDALLAYYRAKCKELGLKDTLSDKPKVTIY